MVHIEDVPLLTILLPCPWYVNAAWWRRYSWRWWWWLVRLLLRVKIR